MQLRFERSLNEAVPAVAADQSMHRSWGWRSVALALYAALGAAVAEKLLGPRMLEAGIPRAATLALGAVAGVCAILLLLSKRSGIDRFLPALIEDLGPWPRLETWTLNDDGLSIEAFDDVHFQPWSLLKAARHSEAGLLFEWKTATHIFLPGRLVDDKVLSAIPMQVESN
jgi:hypothetical protein